MGTVNSKVIFKKIFSGLMAVAVVLTGASISVFAAEQDNKLIENNSTGPRITENSKNSITFYNLDEVEENEIIEYEVTDSQGNPATIGIQLMPNAEKEVTSRRTWKVWFTGVVINAHFYMTVSNNKVTSVYDDWVLVIGGTHDNQILTKTTTQGKLSFKVTSYMGIASYSCWLKGTVTGSNNDITVSYQM